MGAQTAAERLAAVRRQQILAKRWAIAIGMLVPASFAFAQPAQVPVRPVIPGIATERVIPGAPYALAGSRIVFANWYYIQPGDLDWRNAEGKSVYVHGNEGPFAAHHVGIHAPRGIRLVVEKPAVKGPLDRPHRMTLREGDRYKAWTDSDYYESSDGMAWERKARLELDSGVNDGIYHVFIDPRGSPEERYKAIWVGQITREEFDAFRQSRPTGWEPRALVLLEEKGIVSCLRGGVSPDGIRWKTLPQPLVVEYSDTFNTAWFDPVRREYVIYTRQWSIGPRAESLEPDIRNSWTGVGRRAIGRSASRDFRRFDPSELILEPTPDMLPSEQLYTNCHSTIPGAPDQHLMFPAIWNASIDDTTRIAVASSHDGRVWHWLPGGNILETEAFGQWNGGCIWATPELIELPNGDWALPYLAHNFPHKYPRGQLVGNTGYILWPKGRLVGIEAKSEGEFTTISFIPRGRTLKINALTRRTGSVRVEVLGVDGRSLDECVPIVGDHLWTPVTWKGGNDLGVGEGQPVTLRIALKHARLYGLQLE